MKTLLTFANERKALIEFAPEHYEALLKHASENSPVYFRLKNALKTESNLIAVPCGVYEAAMLLIAAIQFCPDAIPFIEQAMRLL